MVCLAAWTEHDGPDVLEPLSLDDLSVRDVAVAKLN
jgi:hypothetical protein